MSATTDATTRYRGINLYHQQNSPAANSKRSASFAVHRLSSIAQHSSDGPSTHMASPSKAQLRAALDVQDLREKIDQHYRVRLILDNLPITTYDLEENPESIRPGYEIGFSVDGKYYLNNHLMFKILVHKTNGQYSKAREEMAELEAAAVVEVCIYRSCCPVCLALQSLPIN